MMFLLIYLLKVGACVLLLFAIYYFLLRAHTFHHINRICLVSILLFSFIAPLIPVAGPSYPMVHISLRPHDTEVINGQYAAEQSDHEADDTGTTTLLLPFAYLLGLFFFTYRFLNSVVRLKKTVIGTLEEQFNGTRIRRTKLNTSFTFINTIYLPEGEKDPIILQHEKAHVAQFHWVDLLIAEIASIVLWFNPVVALLKYELRLQHEYLADRSVIASGISFEDYATCLIAHFKPSAASLRSASGLQSSSTKKRIIMLTKKKTQRSRYLVYGLIVVTAAIALMSFGKKGNTGMAFDGREQVVAPAEHIPDIAPVDMTKVTKISLFGDRMHPVLKEMRRHTGIDFELQAGSDVFATAEGVVVVQRYGENTGNVVRIKHGDTYHSRYYHLERALVKVGDKVKKGQVIGLVGNTGLSSVPHLHYEVLKNDVAVDPKEFLPELPSL